MTSIYLRRIDCANFRVFGGDFRLNLPGPGTTIVTGANGLGKSSLLDAIEWALSDTVTRLARAPGYDKEAPLLRRIGCHADHLVRLAFTSPEEQEEHQTIERRGRSGTEQDIISLLRNPEWMAAISDLGEHLRFTHFLGQSALTRMIFREEDEQWREIHSATGLPYYAGLRARLGGRTTTGFNTIQTGRREEIERLNGELDDLQASVRSRDSMAQAARAGLPATPEMVARACQALLADLTPLVGGHEDIPEEPQALLTFVAQRLDAARAAIAPRLAALQTADGLVSRRRAVEKGLAEATAMAQASEAVIAERQVHQAEALQRRATRDEAVGICRQREKAARARLQQWRDLSEASAGIARAKSTLHAIEAEADRLRGLLESARQRASLVERHRDRRQSLDRGREETAQALIRVASRLAEWSGCQEDLRLAAEDERKSILQEALAAAEVTVTGFEAESERLAEALTVVQAEIRSAERDTAELKGLIAAMSAHVHGDTSQCPLCLSLFPENGALRWQVEKAVGEAGKGLATLKEREISCRRHGDTTVNALAAARKEVEAAAEALAGLRRRREAAEERAAALLRLVPTASDFPSIKTALDQKAADLRQQDAILAGEQATLPTVEDLAAQLKAAHDQVEALSRPLDEVMQAHARETASRETFRQVFHKHEMPLPEGRIDDFAAERAAAETAVRQAEAGLAEALAALEAEDRQLQDIVQALAAAQADLRAWHLDREQRRAELDVLRGLWRGLALEGDPDPAVLRTAVAETQRIESSLPVFASRLEELRQGHRDWMAAGVIQRAEEQLARKCAALGATTAVEAVGILQNRLMVAETRLSASQNAASLARTLAGRMKTGVEAFEADILAPLNDRFIAFCRALSTSGDYLPVVSSRSHMNRKAISWGVRVLEDVAGGEKARPAHQILSEGQLASLALSFLMAASTTFRWSRWPALVLDDPLQHNDLVHLAAFTDLMRRLIEEERYQVILTTHDQAEAEYLFRRLRTVGQGATLCTLRGMGQDGVVWTTRDHRVGVQI
ncbi:MAG: AAA family ATPase [Alphaproteobacteria bacterium]|nr:AAA family ATPase [Alphaproteobacteria bacterium]